MNTYAAPYPIPLLDSAQAQRPVGLSGNTPYPQGLLKMPIQIISWLLYRAITAQQVVEWTPLSEGPGTRVDYTGQPEWDGQKFVHVGSQVLLPSPTDILNFWWGGQYNSPQAARDGVRGYDVLTSEDPDSESWTFEKRPGQWMDAGPYSPFFYGTDGTMRYDVPENWPAAGGEFTAGVSNAIVAWQERLQDWLAAEQLKVPQNPQLIAEIQRQAAISVTIGTQINAAAAKTLTAITNAETTNRLRTNWALFELDSYLQWIAAEEILEAYSATTMPLNLFRQDFAEWVRFLLSKDWYGSDRSLNLNLFLQEVRFLGAGLTTAALGAINTNQTPLLTTGGIPALTTGQIAINLTRPLPFEGISPPYGYNKAFRTIFTLQLTELDTDGVTMLTTDQITAIGPAAIGLTPEACFVDDGATVPFYGNGVTQSPPTTQAFPVLPGVEVGVFRIEDSTSIPTPSVPGVKLYECPLYANSGRVGGLNIIWKILTARS
jgi:hypothetical protein